MKNPSTSITDYVEAAVNRHGELHLDKERTQLLVNWLRAHDEQDKAMGDLISDLQILIEPKGTK